MDNRKELQKEIKDIEQEAYKGFLKKIGVKTLAEYEAQRSTEVAKKYYDRKNELVQALSKYEAELNFIENNQNEQSIKKLEEIVKAEEAKLQALMSDGQNNEYIQKLQQEVQDIEQ